MIDGNIVSNQNIENHAMSHGSASYAVDVACAENVDKSCTAHSKGEGKRLSSFSEDSFGFVAFAKNGCFQVSRITYVPEAHSPPRYLCLLTVKLSLQQR